jgi:hypothetical protein
MSPITLSDSTTLQGLYQDVKFKSGQDSLLFEHFVRMCNFALDDYGYLALTSSGRWKFDDFTHEDSDGDRTLPIATATLTSAEASIPLETDFLMIEKVLVDGKILLPVDQRDFRDISPAELYGSAGTPGRFDYDAHNLFFYPPNDGTSRTVKIHYSRSSPYFDVEETNATIGIPRGHHKYLSLNIRSQLNERTADANETSIERKLLIEETRIRDFFSKRDQTTGRSLKPKRRGGQFAPK